MRSLTLSVGVYLKVYVISDTHDRLDTLEKFLKIVGKSLEPGYLIHLGDVVSPFTLKSIVGALPERLSLKVVLGNNDADKVLLSKIAKDVEDQPTEVEVCGTKALLLHGFKSPELTERVVDSLACSNYYGIVMYGHTHRYRLNKKCSSYVLNPGALSGYLAREVTYGVIDCDTLTASIVDLGTNQSIMSLSIT
ncbi:MAG: YfcE family phosphodiesterase [Sulfolobales archaeon]